MALPVRDVLAPHRLESIDPATGQALGDLPAAPAGLPGGEIGADLLPLSCIANKRAIVADKVYERFVEMVAQRQDALRKVRRQSG